MGLTWVFLMFFIAPQAFAQSITLTATAGQGKVDLSWTEISGAAGYDLYFCEDTTSTACTVPTTGGANPPYLGWITTTTFEHTGLTANRTYRYQVTHYVGGTTRSNIAEAVPLGVTLTAGSITAFTATLTLANHTGNWYYKETAPSSSATCSGAQTTASVNLTGLTASTEYTYKAYSDSSCSTELASETFTTGNFGLTATAGQGKVDLSWTEISGAAGYDLYFCEDTTSTACTVPTTGGANPPYLGWITTTTFEHTGLTANRTYRYQVTHYVGGTTRSNIAEAVPLGVTLTAGSITAFTATLTLANHSGNWHYKETAPSSSATCSGAQTGTSVNLTGLMAGTSYTYKAYSDSSCSTELASVTFNTVYDLGLQVSATSSSSITLSWTNHADVTSGYDVYRCTVQSQCATNPPAGDDSLYLSWVPKPTDNTITLVDDNDTESGGVASPISSGTTYYYAVRGYISGGDTGFSRVTGTAVDPPALTAGTIGATSATLTLAHHTGNWYYKETAPSSSATCSGAQTGTSVNLTGLTASTEYTYKAYSDSTCSTELASVTFTTTAPVPVLVAGSITTTTATLTLTNHSGNWHYKETAPSTTATCSGAQTTTSVNLTSLTAGTSYTYKAYSDSTCSTELASVTFTTTALPVTLTAGSITKTAATLTLAHHTGNWYYQETAPSTTATCSGAQTTTSVNLTSLTVGTVYTYKAYSDSTCSTELASVTFNTVYDLGLQVTATSASSITLSWTNQAGVTSGYDVYRCTVESQCATDPPAGDDSLYLSWVPKPTDNTITLVDGNGTESGGVASPITSGTTYYYAVQGYITGGDTGFFRVTGTADVSSPTAPALAAGTIGATTATLTLSNHTGNWYYKETAPATGTCSGAQTTTSVNLTGLTEGTEYTYKAYSDSTCATELASATFRTVHDLGLTKAASSASAITLSWTNHADVTSGYDVYRCTVRSHCMADPPAGSSVIYLSWVPKPASATVTLVDDNDTEPGGRASPISEGTTYYYAVRGYTAIGDTGFARITATAGTPRKPKPDKPAKALGLIVTSVSAEAISLRWKPSSESEEEIGYGVYRCTVPEGKTTCEPYDDLWIAFVDNTNTYTDTEVTPGETYRYEVAADPLGRDNLSRAVTAVAQISEEMVPPPTDLTVTETTESVVRLSWTAPEDDGRGAIQAIEVYRCNMDRSPDCSEFLHLTGRNPVLTEFRDNKVEPGTTYRYALASYRSAKEVSPWSNQVTATTKRGRNASPTGLTVTATYRDAISLSWTAPADGILGYNVYRCLVPAGETTCEPAWHAWVANPGDAPPAPTSYTDTGGETGGIVRNLTYLYVVAASYPPNYRNGDRSEPVTATARGGRAPEPETPMFPPPAPAGVIAVPGASGIDLSWTAPSDDIAGYSIYRCEEGESPCAPEWIAWVANDGDTPPAPTSYTDTDVAAGVTYRYAVTSNNVDSDGEYHESDWSDEVTVVAREGSPGAPTNLAATPGNEQITLTWTPPAGTVTGWELLVRTDTDTGSWMSITPSGTTTKSYTVTDLTNGVQYTFLVRAVNGMLKGAPAGLRGPTTVPSLNAGEFEASFEAGHQWFRRDVIPQLSGTTTWNSIAWKGERIQQHILVNNVPLNSRLSLAPSDLTTAANDNTIPAGAVSFRYPRFVAGHAEARSCSKDYQEENRTAYLSDALFSEPVQTLPASWPELVWMSVDIPSDTPAGEYSGTVSVRAVSATAIDSTDLHFSIQVVPWTMPDAADRQFHLDLWQFPVSVLDRYNDANPGDRIEIWSEEHYALLEPTYRYLAELGQRTVTTYIKEDALGAPSMIQWTLKRDGSWDYDYSVFDDYVERLASWGLDEQISAFSPIGWYPENIPYWDEANQRKETFSAEVGSSDWNARWQHFLTDFRAHLLERGWFDKTVLYLDETPGGVEPVIDIVSAIDESWKVGLAYGGYGHDGPGEPILSELYDSSGSMALVGATYVDTGLTTGETYRYAVDAVNDRASAASSPITVVAQTPAVPGEPTSLTGGTGTAGVTLNWMAPSAIGSSALTGYNVYRCEDGDASCAPVWFDSVTSGATYTDPYVTANTAYRYTVEACNSTGCGNQAGEITVMTGDTVNGQPVGSDDMAEPGQTPQNRAVPDVPTGLTAFAASATAIQLSWEGSAVKGFDVYRCAGSQTCDPVTYWGWVYADNYTPDPDRVSTYYTSCVQPRPNSFVAAEGNPVDMAALSWHALQRRQDGYLRWAFDNWRSSEPLDVREGSFTAGDFSLVYRSGNDRGMTVVPSIRSELLRDGIEDFEKVQVLRNSLSSCAEDELAGRWLDRLERTVDTFSAAPLMAGRAGDLISQAHDRLGEISVQLTPDMCR